MSKDTIPTSDEAWDDKALGADEKYVRVVDSKTAEQIDDAAGTQLISIRMQKSTIEDLKLIASLNKIGYQTLIKQVMNRFVECEKKQLLRQLVSEKISEKLIQKTDDCRSEPSAHLTKQPRRKIA